MDETPAGEKPLAVFWIYLSEKMREAAAQELPGPVQAGFDGFFGAVKRGGDFRVGKIFVLGKQQGGPLILRQQAHRRRDLVELFARRCVAGRGLSCNRKGVGPVLRHSPQFGRMPPSPAPGASSAA